MKKTFYAPNVLVKTLSKKASVVVLKEEFVEIVVVGSLLTVGLKS